MIPLKWQRPLIWLAVLAAAVFLAYEARPPSKSAELQRAEQLGYRAARSAAFRRRLAAVAVESLHAAQRRADSVHVRELARVRQAAAAALHSTEVHVDSGPRVIVGPAAPGDTLVALAFARAAVQLVADSANVALANMRAVALLERGRSSLAIQRLNETVAAQDTVIGAQKEQIRLLKATRPSLWRRAAGGVTHALASAACGAVGYTLAGPLVGAGAAVACAAVAGIVR